MSKTTSPQRGSKTPSVLSDDDASPSQANATMWFETLSDYKEYQSYVDALRDELRNWCNKKNKTSNDLYTKSQKVNSIITQVLELIDRKALPDKIERLKTKTYSIGDRKHSGKRFSFDKKQIQKEFHERISISKRDY